MTDAARGLLSIVGTDLPGLLSQFWFWLTLTSIACFLLERAFPWRDQRTLRPQLAQDLVWLVLNGHFLGIVIAYVTGRLLLAAGGAFGGAFGLPGGSPGTSPQESFGLLHAAPLWIQAVALLVLKDFLEWGVHNLFHRVTWLWQFHKVHHSVETLDWIGYFRFHWMEGVVYKGLTFLPLVLMGFSNEVMLPIGVVFVAAGYLNHANLNIDWGPLRYVLNSPRMHVWHHDAIPVGGHGKNFGMVLSVWDWLFGTAHLPDGYPERLGFDGIDEYPRGLLGRFFYPLRWRARGRR